ncbi:uncharacterized protein ARMOST_05882 [Armillaria ostoyae]|uniref:Uncharacterized protein n=1 Tax=Armillaria ostoyae TaxID=47428 RepID=A0A284R1G8_ARMOS|nr:uncharacterized protein ARMOST_05882 [Armillaria ostoyae]
MVYNEELRNIGAIARPRHGPTTSTSIVPPHSTNVGSEQKRLNSLKQLFWDIDLRRSLRLFFSRFATPEYDAPTIFPDFSTGILETVISP